jgi:hypothetical protein
LNELCFKHFGRCSLPPDALTVCTGNVERLTSLKFINAARRTNLRKRRNTTMKHCVLCSNEPTGKEDQASKRIGLSAIFGPDVVLKIAFKGSTRSRRPWPQRISAIAALTRCNSRQLTGFKFHFVSQAFRFGHLELCGTSYTTVDTASVSFGHWPPSLHKCQAAVFDFMQRRQKSRVELRERITKRTSSIILSRRLSYLTGDENAWKTHW